MAFDMGFDFRQTSGYVTDPAYAVFASHLDDYPMTYTNTNGYSVNAGFTGGASGNSLDRLDTNDPRIAGVSYINAPDTMTFKVDLSSGSAPGAGTYNIDIAAGYQSGGVTEDVILKDNTTTLITLSGATGGAGKYLDATGAVITATTTWTGATSPQAFATTTVNLGFDLGGAHQTIVAHFRLTLQAAGAAFFPPRMLMLLGVGA